MDLDQDAFRNLLANARQSQRTPTTNNIRHTPTTSSSGPAFKPRKVKKVEGKYRDRAAERREGTGNDYAEVEAVLEDFQKRLVNEDRDVIEQQRQYLGGDSQHTILVKGLDLSLLEQNRARVAASTEDDEVLEQAFTEATSTSQPTEPRKRTREDIIRDLRAKLQSGETTQPAFEKTSEDSEPTSEPVRKTGKFRPIGFKPIGKLEEKQKKRKTKEGKEGVKKKKKVESAPAQSRVVEPVEETLTSQERDNTDVPFSQTAKKQPEPELEPLDEDLDIFDGAGDYEAFPDDESDEERHETTDTRAATAQEVASVPTTGRNGWFGEPESEATRASNPPEETPPTPVVIPTEEECLHLKPLESSALPSIRDFLAMSDATEKFEKRKARKEKKKKKKGGNDEEDDD